MNAKAAQALSVRINTNVEKDNINVAHTRSNFTEISPTSTSLAFFRTISNLHKPFGGKLAFRQKITDRDLS